MVRERVSLAPLTSFRIGGPARFFIEAEDEHRVREACVCARERQLPLLPLGGGSNILVPDAGVEAVVVKVTVGGIAYDAEHGLLQAGAGVSWDQVVRYATSHGLWGIENLAGIPGSAGGALVQNIGAYGAEVSHVFAHAEAIDTTTGALVRVGHADARLGYRTSVFKERRELIIVRIALTLAREGASNLTYTDLLRAKSQGIPLATPHDIAGAVRAIRAEKFPTPPEGGTAGSFFKNPSLCPEDVERLRRQYPALPLYPQSDGRTKVSLAWILDHILTLKGHAKGRAHLYEKQPLVIVAEEGAHAGEVDALAREVAERVYGTTGIAIEREVETFGTA